MTRKTSPSQVRKPHKGGISIVKTESLPLVRLADIEFAPRPDALPSVPVGGEGDVPFFNPRPLEEVLEPASFQKLLYSIRIDGLLEAPVVRAWVEGKTVVRLQHVAGERRLRCLHEIVAQCLPCVDDKSPKPEHFKAGAVVNWRNRFGTVVRHAGDAVTVLFDDHLNDTDGKGEQLCRYADLLPTKTGDVAYEYVAVNMFENIDDGRAMRVAYAENDGSEPLSTRAEVLLIERYVAAGYAQKKIAYLLNTNITFVSQRASFRSELPKEAFEKLMSGHMRPNVAVQILALAPADRAEAWRHCVEREKVETAASIRKHRAAKEQAQDEAACHEADAAEAEAAGRTSASSAANRRAASARRRADKEGERLDRAVSESGCIKQGHMERGAAAAGVRPKRGRRRLSDEELEAIYVSGLEACVREIVQDPVTGKVHSRRDFDIMQRTAKAILAGETDPIAVLRGLYVDHGKWKLPKNATPAPPPKRRRADEDDEDQADVERDELDEEEDADLDEDEIEDADLDEDEDFDDGDDGDTPWARQNSNWESRN